MDYIVPETNFLKVSSAKTGENSSAFIIEPLSPGYGVTIANSLRRIILSSLEGAAVDSVRIEGATHEFTTIKGMKEDVVDLILNIKSLRVKSFSDEPVVLKLSIKGPKKVTALDFSKNSEVEIVDQDHYIASLEKGGKLDMEMTITKGRGYVPVERKQDKKAPLGTILLDSSFAPVRKVHYEIENTRVGGMTNFDKVIFDITTDGTITPEEALETSTSIMMEHLGIVSEALKSQSKNKEVSAKKKVTIRKTAAKRVGKKQK